ncbi:MAG: type II toxin-antitoxin system HicB family antitoxin [Bacteroidales bacterium]|nr:type II toxin-antitoxin system HicB family antitoxin [Bacteroidales bacterium]
MANTVRVDVYKTGTGFAAHVEDVPGVITTGKTLDEIKPNMIEALELHIEGMREDGDPIPKCLKGKYELYFKMDVESLLEYYSGILTQSAISRLTGINVKQLNHYATGKSKPRAQQVRKIESGLHKLGSELLQIQL